MLERISELIRLKGYLGISSLIKDTAPGEKYYEIVRYVFDNQKKVKTSHIHSVIMQAMDGKFGNLKEDVWISPLLNLIWFFDLEMVYKSHLFIEYLNNAENMWEAAAIAEGFRKGIKVKNRNSIPI